MSGYDSIFIFIFIFELGQHFHISHSQFTAFISF